MMRTGNNLEIQQTLELVNTDVRIRSERRVTGGVNNIEQPSDVSEGSGGKLHGFHWIVWDFVTNLFPDHFVQDTEWRAHQRALTQQAIEDVQALVGSLQGTGQMSMWEKEMRTKSLLVLEEIFRSCKSITRPKMLSWESSLGKRIRLKLQLKGMKQDSVWRDFGNQFRRDHKEKVWSVIGSIGKKVKGKWDDYSVGILETTW